MAVGGMSKQEVADFINANIGILRYLIGTFSNAYRAEYEASQIGGLYKFGNGLDGVMFKAIENFFTLQLLLCSNMVIRLPLLIPNA